jgi:SAM-dependent methyltransferase
VQVEQTAEESGREQEVLAAVGELPRARLVLVEASEEVGDVLPERGDARARRRLADEIRDQHAGQHLYEEAIRRTGLGAGQEVLEVGCGTGVFLRAAADRGAHVVGLDASAALLELARDRVPEAELVAGDLQFLPFDDARFDVVAGFNSFFFAADIAAALREVGRVAKPGAPVVIQVWGRPDRCDLTALKQAMAALVPAPDAGAPASPALWEPGVLEAVAAEAGLAPQSAFDLSWAYEFPDEDTLGRAMLAPGNVVGVIEAVGEGPVRAAIIEALAPYRTRGGGYRLENEWHTLIATA